MGLSRAGFDHEALVEVDNEACATIRRNKKARVKHVAHWPLIEKDVREYDYEGIKQEPDLLAAGVPCQPFSHGGKKLGDYDHRNMFPEITRAARALRPKIILIENVRGILNANFSDYFGYITRKLSLPLVEKLEDEDWLAHDKRLKARIEKGEQEPLSYEVTSVAVNAADYGVPQWRERAIIVALRRDLSLTWKMPGATHSLDALLWSRCKSGDYWEEHGLPVRKRAHVSRRFQSRLAEIREMTEKPDELQRWRTVRDAIKTLPKIRQGQTAEGVHDHYLNPGARAYEKHTGSHIDEPAKTLKAGSHGVPGGENSLHLGRGRVRYFSVRECARLQTFPDSYAFATTTWTRGMRQIGNAVPVLLGEVVGRSIAATLNRRAAAVVVQTAVTKPKRTT